MSMISEQVKRLRKLANQWKHNDVAGCNLIFEAADTIEALSAKVREQNFSAEPKTGWIPVSERLPEDNGCMLVTIDDAIEFGKYEDGEWSIWVCEHWDKWGAKGVTAWMPLPEPYREDESDA